MTETQSISFPKQLWHFFVHLRLHYQFFILSGGFLLGALYASDVNWNQYFAQFLNVHVLLFGGATAYNSYWDKDEGAIGGLKNPPKMRKWMWIVSLAIQYVGMVIAFQIGYVYLSIYIFSFILFWLYSTPLARWKGHPILSLIAIGFSTGTNSFLLGYLATGNSILNPILIIASFGVALVLLSLYPVSQVFQIEEDTARGDKTFASVFGLNGIKRFYVVSYLTGIFMVAYSLSSLHYYLGLLFGIVSILSFVIIGRIVYSLKGMEEEYGTVMRIKFLASFSFVIFIISSIVIKNLNSGIEKLDFLF